MTRHFLLSAVSDNFYISGSIAVAFCVLLLLGLIVGVHRATAVAATKVTIPLIKGQVRRAGAHIYTVGEPWDGGHPELPPRVSLTRDDGREVHALVSDVEQWVLLTDLADASSASDKAS